MDNASSLRRSGETIHRREYMMKPQGKRAKSTELPQKNRGVPKQLTRQM